MTMWEKLIYLDLKIGKFLWKRVDILGIVLHIPIISFIVRKNEEQITEFAKYKKEMAVCDRCHALFNGRLGTRFIIHLQHQHNVPEDEAITIVSDLYHNLLILKHRNKDAQAAAERSHCIDTARSVPATEGALSQV